MNRQFDDPVTQSVYDTYMACDHGYLVHVATDMRNECERLRQGVSDWVVWDGHEEYYSTQSKDALCMVLIRLRQHLGLDIVDSLNFGSKLDGSVSKATSCCGHCGDDNDE